MQFGDVELIRKPVHLFELLEALGHIFVPAAPAARATARLGARRVE
jgi:hypothetical protein